MGVRGFLFVLLGVVLLYTCIPSVVGHGGQEVSGYAGYGRDGRRGYGTGSYGYGYGRWWCTCRWWCRYDEWTVRYKCVLPFFQYFMRTCCKRLPWYKTNGYGFGGYSNGNGGLGGGFGGRYDGSNGNGEAYSRPGGQYGGYAGYGSYPSGSGLGSSPAGDKGLH